MNNISDEQLIIMQASIESNKQDIISNKQYSDEKMMNLKEYFKSMLTSITYQINTFKSSPNQKDSYNNLYPAIVVLDILRDSPLDSGKSTKIGGMWTLKHEISSQTFYELLIKTELKGDTTLDLNNFYNHMKMCLNEGTRLWEDFLPGYLSIKQNSDSE